MTRLLALSLLLLLSTTAIACTGIEVTDPPQNSPVDTRAVADVTGFAGSLIHTFSSITTFAATSSVSSIGNGIEVDQVGDQRVVFVNRPISGFATFGTIRIDPDRSVFYDLTLDSSGAPPVAFTGHTTLTVNTTRVDERGSWRFDSPGDFRYDFQGNLRYARASSNFFPIERYPTGLLTATLRYNNGATFSPLIDFDGSRFAHIGVLNRTYPFDLVTGQLL